MGDTKLDKTEQLNCTSYCVKDGKGLAFLFEDRTEKKKSLCESREKHVSNQHEKSLSGREFLCGQCLS